MDSGQDQQEDKGAVSRSGRVRKKSSKLNDFFESPEEALIKPRRGGAGRPARKAKVTESSNSDSSEFDEDDDLSDVDLKGVVSFENQWEELDEGSDLLCAGSKNDSDEDMLRMADNPKSQYPVQAQAYGSIGRKKSQKKKQNRKDKGKTRLTAYMLWSKHVRGEIVQQNPTMDFSAVNKRLGELWATVPTAQKYNWQNKATKIAVRSEKQLRGSMISTGKRRQVGQKAGKGTPGRKPDLKMAVQLASNPQRQDYQTPKQTKLSLPLADTSPPGVFKVTGTSPIDVAAHLKLLGESLNNIGQKLKEHEGQIAVSGSLSVLLDSMLCVLGPLACLTNEIDIMRDAIPEDIRVGILDNIAYIMPGIV